MSLKLSAVHDDVTNVPADALLLKHAGSFYGADEAVALRLTERSVCELDELAVAQGDYCCVETRGAIAAARVLILGVARLGEFRYRAIRRFAAQAIDTLSRLPEPVRVLTTTTHGAGYGLDVEESLREQLLGFQQGLAARPLPGLEQIVFVERNKRRFELIREVLHETQQTFSRNGAPPRPSRPVAETSTSSGKQCVFVAMPFAEEFEDTYQFGIYGPVRQCGYVCEKVDQTVFAGSIVDRITNGIRNAKFVVADLTQERPNVYLEVGFAWGVNKPVILIAREGQHLHFDLSQHKCLFYRTIKNLSVTLEHTILEMFGRGDGEPHGIL